MPGLIHQAYPAKRIGGLHFLADAPFLDYLLHHAQAGHIHHQCIIAEACPALAEHDIIVAGLAHLLQAVFHIPRGEKLRLFDIDAAAGLSGGHQQIGLTAEECRNLQNVRNLGDGLCLLGLMNIRAYGQAIGILDFLQNAEPLLKTGAAEAVQ